VQTFYSSNFLIDETDFMTRREKEEKRKGRQKMSKYSQNKVKVFKQFFFSRINITILKFQGKSEDLSQKIFIFSSGLIVKEEKRNTGGRKRLSRWLRYV
jgi:hypothetical protein